MSAYVVAEMAVTDPDGYEKYKPLAETSLAAHGGTYRVRGGRVDSLEGDPVEGRFVLIEFPDVETARRWYRSDEYQAAVSLRQAAAHSRVFIVDGYEPD